MKKRVMTLLVAGLCIGALPAFAEDGGYPRKAIPDSAIETGNGVWSPSPSPSVVYTRRGRWIAPASLTSGTYVSANIGGVEMNNGDFSNYYNYNSGVTLLGAVGYGFKNNCRLEGEVGYQTNNNNNYYGVNVNRDISVLSFLANGYYDIPAFGVAQPYITAGVGVANVNAGSLSLPGGLLGLRSINESAFAYQVGAGVTIPLNSNMKLDARYRYFATNVTVDTLFDNNRLSSNSVLLGLKIGI
jgi:opacity protein-like surface antigen